MIVDSTNPRIMADNIRELAINGGGSGLPEVTVSDDGKILGVVEGSWDKMNAPIGLLDYSETEQNTGRKWIDGKDIYQKTFSGTLSATNASFSLPEGTENIICFDGLLKASDGFFPLNEYVADNAISYAHIVKDGENYSMAIYSNVKPDSNYLVTVYYTKVTATKKRKTTKGEI